MVNEVIIIGSGPAGLTAGIYLARFMRKPLIIDGDLPGGQLMKTGAVENWPGTTTIQGPSLIRLMREQAAAWGCVFLDDSVVGIDCSSRPYRVMTKQNRTFETKAIIVATGASPKKLGCPGEQEFWGRGVNACATCDAPLYKNKDVVVVGGGNSAIAESYALSKFANKVTILQSLDSLTANDPLTKTVLENPRVSVMCNVKVIRIMGVDTVRGVVVQDVKTNEEIEILAQGVFVAIGYLPNSTSFKGQLEINEQGYITRVAGAQTSKPGVFAAGDVADYRYRQAITASGEGCAAALECEGYLKRL